MVSDKYLRGLADKCFRSVADNHRYEIFDFLHVLLDAAQRNDYVEGSCRVVSGACDAETLFDRLEGVDYLQLIAGFKEDVVRSIPGIRLMSRNRKIMMAGDVTCEAYYGDDPSEWVHGYRSHKGATGSYQLLVVSVLSGSRREIVGVLPLRKTDDPKELLLELLDDLKGRLRIDGILLDRGFDSGQLIWELRHRKIPFLMLWRQAKWTRNVFAEMGHNKWHRMRHTLQHKDTTITFTLIFVKGIRVKDDKRAYNWVFATNMRKGKPSHYIHQYKKRWGIETLFRVLDEQHIKTKSKNITTRLFLTLVTIYLYNTWKEITSHLKQTLTFSDYTSHLTTILQEQHPPRPPTPQQQQIRHNIQTLLNQT